MTAWTCDLHNTVNFGDCPTCDHELASLSEED